MAKDKKKDQDTTEHTQAEGAVEAPAAAAVEAPKLSKTERKALFETYGAADKVVNEAKAKLAEAETARNAVVGDIKAKCGKGPFMWNGKVTLIVSRGDKHFFRGKGENEIENID